MGERGGMQSGTTIASITVLLYPVLEGDIERSMR